MRLFGPANSDSTLARRRRVLLSIVLVAGGSAGAGWWAGQRVESPDEAARNAAAPSASRITVPVQRRTLATSVVVRGDVMPAQAVDVTVDPDIGDGLATLIVTGRVPKPGAELAAGDVALEVSGRPVYVLPGSLPTFRSLRPGSEGADVKQLETALRSLRHFRGTPDTVYDLATADAVARLYGAAGYSPVGPSAAELQQKKAAEAAVTAARGALRQAEQALATARKPPPRSAILGAKAAVAEARADLDEAFAAYEAAVASGADGATIASLNRAVATARARLEVAEAELGELLAPRDTSNEARAVTDAEGQLSAAEADLAELKAGQGIRVPRGEIVFVPSLPRRVDKVHIELGEAPAGPALALAGATLQVDASVSAEERGLLSVGDRAVLDDRAAGVELSGTVAVVAETPGTNGAPAGSYYLRITPDTGDPARISGLNLRVVIPVESTGGAVLVVPQSALVTDAAGVVRVRVERDGRVMDLPVTPGLAAEGLVQVDGPLNEGDLVVVDTDP